MSQFQHLMSQPKVFRDICIVLEDSNAHEEVL